MEIICQHCGSTDFTSMLKSGQLVATCTKCQRFIKNIPYAEPALYFGKYKGKPIKDYDDINYLHWLRNNPELWGRLNHRVKEAINLKLDGKI